MERRKVIAVIAVLLLSVGISCHGEKDRSNDLRYKLVRSDLVHPWDLTDIEDDIPHLAIIVSNVNDNQMNDEGVQRELAELKMMKKGFARMVDSIFTASQGTPLHLIFITDVQSKPIVEKVMADRIGKYLSTLCILNTFDAKAKFPGELVVDYVSLHSITEKYREEIDEMKKYYVRPPLEPIIEEKENGGALVLVSSSKYLLDLFFIAPFYPHVFKMDKLMVVDFDLKFQIDIKELYQFFFKIENQWLAIAEDQMKHYQTMKEFWQKKSIEIGREFPAKTQTGINSAVVLFNLKRMRECPKYQAAIQKEAFKALAVKWYMAGSLGDQDWLTALAWENPDQFYLLPCEYNFQLHQIHTGTCQTGYKILHGILPGKMEGF